jgi:hypothetical protein
MRDSSGGRNSFSQPFLGLPRLRPAKAQRLSDQRINRIAQPPCLARLGNPKPIQKSGDAISHVLAKTFTSRDELRSLWRDLSELLGSSSSAAMLAAAFKRRGSRDRGGCQIEVKVLDPNNSEGWESVISAICLN